MVVVAALVEVQRLTVVLVVALVDLIYPPQQQEHQDKASMVVQQLDHKPEQAQVALVEQQEILQQLTLVELRHQIISLAHQ